MQEVELRFQVPPDMRSRVEAALATAGAARTRLQATYFDTPDRRLAAAGMALRVRKEGRRWMQTLKAGGMHAMQRFEHNVALPASAAALHGAAPRPELALHAHTEGGELLMKVLGTRPRCEANALEALLRTDIRRCHRVLRTRGGSVELALDVGFISAGHQRLSVCELEIELHGGAPSTVLDVSRRWVQRFGLWLEVRSKAERGMRLADAESAPSAVASSSGTARAIEPLPPSATVIRATPLKLQPRASAEQALRDVAANCLSHLLPNASEVASASYRPEHVHQLRVALRRLRTALRFFEGWADGIAPAQASVLAGVFGQLGGTRDRDALLAEWVPALRAAGAPWVDLPPALGGAEPSALLRDKRVTLAWLDLLGLTLAGTGMASAVQDRFEPLAAQRLDEWHRQVLRGAKHFAPLDAPGRHRLRKRAKRLRYACEFVLDRFDERKAARYLKALAALQESLGRANDIRTALAAYRGLVEHEARAWFAVGWLQSREDQQRQACEQSLKPFLQAKPFWRSGSHRDAG